MWREIKGVFHKVTLKHHSEFRVRSTKSISLKTFEIIFKRVSLLDYPHSWSALIKFNWLQNLSSNQTFWRGRQNKCWKFQLDLIRALRCFSSKLPRRLPKLWLFTKKSPKIPKLILALVNYFLHVFNTCLLIYKDIKIIKPGKTALARNYPNKLIVNYS